MVLRKRCAILFAAVIATSTILAAQDKDVFAAKLNDTKTFLLKQRVTTEYRDGMRKSVLGYESSLENHCKNVELDFDSADVRDRILAPIRADDQGVPVAGTWRESVPGTACNEKRKYNVQVNVTPKGLVFITTFPGDAEGDPELQNDTLQNIETNFVVLRIPTKKSCHITVVDTRLVGARSTALESGLLSPWKESWDVKTCGKVYVVPITFIPDNTGTSISVGTSEIRPL